MDFTHSFVAGDLSLNVPSTPAKHPKALHAITGINDTDIAILVFSLPDGSAHVTVSVFVDKKQHIVFSGKMDEMKEFFSKFPKN